MNLSKWIKDQIERVQNGQCDRASFPEEWKAQIAKAVWDKPLFSYGMEYGYLLALADLQKALEQTIGGPT